MVSPRGGSLGITQSLTAAVNSFVAIRGLDEAKKKREEADEKNKLIATILKSKDLGEQLNEKFKEVPGIDQQTPTPTQQVTGGTSGQAVGPGTSLGIGPEAIRSGSTPRATQQLGGGILITQSRTSPAQASVPSLSQLLRLR